MLFYLSILVNRNRCGPLHSYKPLPPKHVNNLHQRLAFFVASVDVLVTFLIVKPINFLPELTMTDIQPNEPVYVLAWIDYLNSIKMVAKSDA